MKPKVSIIVPVYNHERYVACCIESVLRQTCKDWEMIIIDDCSTDKTQGIVSRYLWDDRIKYIRHMENYGKEKLRESHNEALALAKGEFITVLEGDDYWPDYRLEKQLRFFDDGNVVLCHGGVALDKDGRITVWNKSKNIPAEILTNNPVGTALKFFLYGRIPVIAQSVMFRKFSIDKTGGFRQIPSLYLVDYPTWMDIALQGKFAFIPEVMGYWRRHSSSITSRYQEQLWQGVTEYVEKFVSVKKSELDSLHVKLGNCVKYPGGYALSALYKTFLLENRRKEARRCLYNIWKKRRAYELCEIMKICFLIPCAFVPFLTVLYRKYIQMRTEEFSPVI